MKSKWWAVLFFSAALLMAGCSAGTLGDDDDDFGPGGTPGGATPGGTQDLQMARSLIEQGYVPYPEALIVEGMFSEHDLPLEGDGSCADLLCLKAALGLAPGAGDETHGWVQLGMSSNIDPALFETPLTAVFVIDVSGSMSYGYADGTTGGEIAKALAHAITDQLDEADRVAIVTFSDIAKLKLDLTNGADPAIATTIDALAGEASTNMEAGVALGFEIANAAAATSENTRVFLLTDAQPNVGNTDAGSFIDIVNTGVEHDVGLTVFGTALGLNYELMDQVSQTRGANAFSVMDPEKVPTFMDDHWPYLTTPIAYNLSMQVDPDADTEVINAYGFPGTQPEDLARTVKSIFVSKGRGGVLLELNAAPIETCGLSLDLSFEELDGNIVNDTLSVSHDGSPLDADGEYFPQVGLHKATALALLVDGMRTATEQYQDGDKDAAIATLEAVFARFDNAATKINDPDIDAENEFWPQLLDLVQNDAEQGTFYP